MKNKEKEQANQAAKLLQQQRNEAEKLLKQQRNEAEKLLKQQRNEAVQRIQEIDAEMHKLTKEKNLLSVTIQKLDGKPS